MKKRLFSKKGVIMAETVIAIMIVSLVTLTSLSMFMTSIHTTRSAVYKSQAQHFAEDALTCFRAADNAEAFSVAVAYRGGYVDFNIVGKNYTYVLSGSNYKASAWVDYPAGGRPTFSIQITDDAGTVIAGITDFEKGA